MDIGSTGAQGRVVQLHEVTKASALAVAQQAHQLSSQGFATGVNSAPNVSTSPNYSPALYAQAAQYQVYTQSGTLASLLNAQGAANSVSADQQPINQDDGSDIHAVEETSTGNHIDTHA